MKKFLSAVLVIGLLAVSAWIAWTIGRSTAEQDRMATAPTRDTAPAIAANRASRDTTATPAENDAQALESVYPEPPAGAIRDEVALVFDSQTEYEQALEWLRSQGVEILDTLPGLNAIRISTGDSIWERLGAGPDQVGYNFPVATPPPVSDSPYQSTYNPGFGDTVLSFLGVDEVDPDWGAGVTIAVLDSGVMRDHVDLEDARILALSHDGRIDEVGHGTAVASLIAGQEEPVLGLTPGATILSLPVLNEDGVSDTFRVSEAILQAVDQGARIISMSLGAYGDSKVLRQAVKYAHDRGVVLVASTGNDGAGQVAFPAAYDGVLAVAAVDATGQPASFSNYGPEVDIGAPGVGITVAWTGDQFASVSGTSFSAPLVAAAVALVMQQNPRLSGKEAVRIVLDNANESALPGKDEFVGDGVLNIERILDRDRRGIFDAAVACYTLEPETSSAGAYQLNVTVENRGTEYLSQVNLSVAYDDVEDTYYLGALSPGDIATQPVLVSPEALERPNGVSILSSVSINGDDVRPANDSLDNTLRVFKEQ